MNNEKLSERVERELKEWKNRYEIPYDEEFKVKTLLKLQEEYDNTEMNQSTTLTRRTLLDMIQQLQKHLNLKEKNINTINTKILIVDNKKNMSIIRLINAITQVKNIKESPNATAFILNNGMKIDIASKSGCREGKTYDDYINLTGDMEFERNFLYQLLRNK